MNPEGILTASTLRHNANASILRAAESEGSEQELANCAGALWTLASLFRTALDWMDAEMGAKEVGYKPEAKVGSCNPEAGPLLCRTPATIGDLRQADFLRIELTFEIEVSVAEILERELDGLLSLSLSEFSAAIAQELERTVNVAYWPANNAEASKVAVHLNEELVCESERSWKAVKTDV